MTRFHTLYRDTIVPELIKKFGYKTVMQVCLLYTSDAADE